MTESMLAVDELSARARHERAIMHAGDALRAVAAVCVALYILPVGGVLLAGVGGHLLWLAFFISWITAQAALHLLLIRSAEAVLDNPRPHLLIALNAGALILGLAVAAQWIIILLFGRSLIALMLLIAGLFDLIALLTLLYAAWAAWRAVYSRWGERRDRHVGFEVVVPAARTK